MNVPMPDKPKIGKGIIIYTIIAFFLLVWIISAFIPKREVFYCNYDGKIDDYDEYCYDLLYYDEPTSEDKLYAYLVFPSLLLSPCLIYGLLFFMKYRKYNLAQKDYPEYLRQEIANLEKQIKISESVQAQIDAEYQAAVQSQNATEPWAVRYSTSPCPYCGHYKVRYAKWEDKSMSVAFWGIASSKLGTNYKCEHCNKMW